MTLRNTVALALSTTVSACSDGQGTPTAGSDVPCPTNLAELAAQVLRPSCIDSGCHGSDDGAGGLDLETNALELELFGREACGGTACVDLQTDAQLAPELIDTIAIWICQGAANN